MTHSQGTTVIRENKIAPLSKVGRFDKAIITTLARPARVFDEKVRSYRQCVGGSEEVLIPVVKGTEKRQN